MVNVLLTSPWLRTVVPLISACPTRQRRVRLERATLVQRLKFTCQAFSSDALPRSEDSKLAVILSLTEKPSVDASN
jgi:hypothetical protein